MKEKYFENYILKLDEIYDPNQNNPKDLETSSILIQSPKIHANLVFDLEKIREKQTFTKMKHIKEEWDELLSLQKQNEKFLRKNVVCRNKVLMDKMQDGILSSLLVYFDEIFNILMDEILEEEVKKKHYINKFLIKFYIKRFFI